MASEGRPKRRRAYRPKVEALEALRLLDAAALTLKPLIAEHGNVGQQPSSAPAQSGHDAWDAALESAGLSDLIGQPSEEEVGAGLAQLNRYLGRAWARAGIAPQQFDDSTQAVYATMLQNLGPARFQQLAAEIHQNGVRDVLNRDSTEGPDFFRAVDMVKKRALREKTLTSLDDQGDVAVAAGSDGAAENRRGALREAIARSLNPREAELIQATLQGFSPAEIASRWGVAPKTVSNEKTRALSKLRAVLSPDLLD